MRKGINQPKGATHVPSSSRLPKSSKSNTMRWDRAAPKLLNATVFLRVVATKRASISDVMTLRAQGFIAEEEALETVLAGAVRNVAVLSVDVRRARPVVLAAPAVILPAIAPPERYIFCSLLVLTNRFNGFNLSAGLGCAFVRLAGWR